MNTTASLIGLAVTLLLVPVFIRVFKFRDFTLGIIGVLSMMAKNLCIAFSKYHIYVYYIGKYTFVYILYYIFLIFRCLMFNNRKFSITFFFLFLKRDLKKISLFVPGSINFPQKFAMNFAYVIEVHSAVL